VADGNRGKGRVSDDILLGVGLILLLAVGSQILAARLRKLAVGTRRDAVRQARRRGLLHG
jgi:hypothetical protein